MAPHWVKVQLAWPMTLASATGYDARYARTSGLASGSGHQLPASFQGEAPETATPEGLEPGEPGAAAAPPLDTRSDEAAAVTAVHDEYTERAGPLHSSYSSGGPLRRPWSLQASLAASTSWEGEDGRARLQAALQDALEAVRGQHIAAAAAAAEGDDDMRRRVAALGRWGVLLGCWFRPAEHCSVDKDMQRGIYQDGPAAAATYCFSATETTWTAATH